MSFFIGPPAAILKGFGPVFIFDQKVLCNCLATAEYAYKHITIYIYILKILFCFSLCIIAGKCQICRYAEPLRLGSQLQCLTWCDSKQI